MDLLCQAPPAYLQVLECLLGSPRLSVAHHMRHLRPPNLHHAAACKCTHMRAQALYPAPRGSLQCLVRVQASHQFKHILESNLHGSKSKSDNAKGVNEGFRCKSERQTLRNKCCNRRIRIGQDLSASPILIAAAPNMFFSPSQTEVSVHLCHNPSRRPGAVIHALARTGTQS